MSASIVEVDANTTYAFHPVDQSGSQTVIVVQTSYASDASGAIINTWSATDSETITKGIRNTIAPPSNFGQNCGYIGSILRRILTQNIGKKVAVIGSSDDLSASLITTNELMAVNVSIIQYTFSSQIPVGSSLPLQSVNLISSIASSCRFLVIAF